MLLTLNVPFDEAAVDMAIETAADTGADLYICDAMAVPPTYVACSARSWAERDNREHLAAAGRRASAVGVRVTQMAFHNPRPITATLEVARSERIGLLVFGADRKRLGRLTYRRAVRRLRDEATCLVWTGE
jgi:nucleotide-binding universal stress UspA family protein